MMGVQSESNSCLDWVEIEKEKSKVSRKGV